MNVNLFASSTSPKIINTVNIDYIFNQIKTPNKKIIKLRELGKSHPNFQNLKLTLPTVRFNFLFNNYAKNDNIIESTGLIYLDVDNCFKIENNPFIYAYWKSVSNTGYGILVKVKGLNKDNFNNIYNELSHLLKLNLDKGAKKPTQQTIISYDENIYINNNSITYIPNLNNDYKKVSFKFNYKKERLVGAHYTFSEKLRFTNIDDYFQGDNKDLDYVIFEDNKEMIVSPYLPKTIKEGMRNKTLYYHLTQYALLNPQIGYSILRKIADKIVSHFQGEIYSESKIDGIVRSVIKKREECELNLYANKERRILFNPNKELTIKQKLQISGKIMGEFKKDKTKEKIYNLIESWDYENNGKITQQLISIELNMGIATIKRYWSEFKDYVKTLNNDFKSIKK